MKIKMACKMDVKGPDLNIYQLYHSYKHLAKSDGALNFLLWLTHIPSFFPSALMINKNRQKWREAEWPLVIKLLITKLKTLFVFFRCRCSCYFTTLDSLSEQFSKIKFKVKSIPVKK